MPSFGEHSFAQRCDHRYERVMFVDCEMKPEEANEPSKMFLRFVVGSPCSLAPPFIWLVQLWAQGLTWKQGPISLDWYFCHLVSSSLHLYWEAQDSFEPMHTDLYRSCLPRELGMPFANDWMR